MDANAGPIQNKIWFRRGIATGFFLVALLTIACSLLGAVGEPQAKFHRGQVVAIIGNEDPPQYFRVGFVDKEFYTNSKVYFKYSDANVKTAGEWPEESLRALTRKECEH